ncbi:hypothetical protein [Afifella marina]|uniref:Uncharacterized protein n=1 Tax=Afifella marina DSM 2698 TaxID=1120955 RepID=A0A1G5N497_AFIMA|nr:hypothetical protein [Afifella marina]MBK1622456.1 hypothetical protein [Afifella marina DSM 2698]MBK1626830.1 hypothetical protein [Afifella marina]MBK5919240.1 hypothetical protein [Afifella marina]RAI21281.1 hypothetical protein CH311_07345 [Afifella marina DSM 2698]SCZ32245.1 hypothetical protein SAMN03080610_01495 [Afifella marina DSM 2698]
MRSSFGKIFSPIIIRGAVAAGSIVAAAPALAGDPCLDIAFTCRGAEPFWSFTTGVDAAGREVVRFSDPENPGYQESPLVMEGCVEQGAPNDFELTTDEPLDLIASIVGQSCTEPSGETTDFSVMVSFKQGAQTAMPREVTGKGCCVREK